MSCARPIWFKAPGWQNIYANTKTKLQEPKDLFNFYLKGGGAKLNEELVKMLKQ
jgi:hypothetical protein